MVTSLHCPPHLSGFYLHIAPFLCSPYLLAICKDCVPVSTHRSRGWPCALSSCGLLGCFLLKEVCYTIGKSLHPGAYVLNEFIVIPDRLWGTPNSRIFYSPFCALLQCFVFKHFSALSWVVFRHSLGWILPGQIGWCSWAWSRASAQWTWTRWNSFLKLGAPVESCCWLGINWSLQKAEQGSMVQWWRTWPWSPSSANK